MSDPTQRANRPWKTATLAGMASYLDSGALVTSGIAIGGSYAGAHLLGVAVVVLVLRMTMRESAEWSAARHAADTDQAVDAERIRFSQVGQLFRPPVLVAVVTTGLYYATWNLGASTLGRTPEDGKRDGVIRNHDFHHDGLTLRSTVHVPDGPAGARWPVVVFLHGFTSNRLELPSFVGMSRLLETDGIAIAPVEYAQRYLDHHDGNAELEIVPGADHGWGTVPHRTRLHRSTAEFFHRELF